MFSWLVGCHTAPTLPDRLVKLRDKYAEEVIQQEGMYMAMVEAQAARQRPVACLIRRGGIGADVEELVTWNEILIPFIEIALPHATYADCHLPGVLLG